MSASLVRPEPRRHPAVLTLGVLNIVLGGLTCVCIGGYEVMQAAMAVAMPPLMATVQEQIDTQRARQEQRLNEDLAQAETDEQKLEIEKARQQMLLQYPNFNLAGMYAWMGDPQYIGYLLADAITGMVTNLLLIVSGVGLLYTVGWARQMALIVAGVKIVLVLLSAAYLALVVMPILGKGMDQMMNEMQQMQRSMPVQVAPMPPMAFGKMYQVMGVFWAAMLALIGSVYPVVLLVVLNLPRVKRAFPLPAGAA